MDYIPYTYLVGWSKLNKWYYGVEYGMKKDPPANPENLWSTYFTSSKTVQHLREKYGEPDIIQIRKKFYIGCPEQRMENSITWEKKVLSKIDITEDIWINGRIGGDICPETNKKIALIRYGVENVFQAEEIKEKTKKTNLIRYGVEHPSYSKELLDKKKQNNIKKYGVSCTLVLPETRRKATEGIKTDESKNKRKIKHLKKYGVENPSQRTEVKNKIMQTRENLSNREIVKLIREYKRVFDFKLDCGWYQSPDNKIELLIDDLIKKYGNFTLEEISKIKVDKKYSSSIKKLQERQIVKEIKKYKERFGRKISIGRCWDRKNESYLKLVLQELVKKYGKL